MYIRKLYDKTSTGKTKIWNIQVDKLPNGSGEIKCIFGLLGGKQQTQVKIISKGKNIGKSNETTPYEQACLEAESTLKKKQDKGYTADLAGLEIRPKNAIKLPMLAHTWLKRAHDIVYPAARQPKLNGVRCFVECISMTEIVFTSRRGKEYTTLDHLIPGFLSILKPGEIYDGEIYVHGWTFQEIVRAIKKFRPVITPQLEFHAYDLPSESDYFDRGKELFDRISQCNDSRIKFVATDFLNSPKDVKQAHDEYVKEGYEGVMIRNFKGSYKFKHRSKDLQKYKEFIDDEEFIIVGGKEGTGSDAGCVIFEVDNSKHAKTKEAKTFWVRPKGSVAQRQKWFNNLTKIIGKKLTVQYQEFSEDGVPIFPIGIIIRDYE